MFGCIKIHIFYPGKGYYEYLVRSNTLHGELAGGCGQVFSRREGFLHCSHHLAPPRGVSVRYTRVACIRHVWQGGASLLPGAHGARTIQGGMQPRLDRPLPLCIILYHRCYEYRLGFGLPPPLPNPACRRRTSRSPAGRMPWRSGAGPCRGPARSP